MAKIRQTRLWHLCWAFRDHAESKTEGVQSPEIIANRIAETKYWQQKIGYNFRASFCNPWYVAWVFWRILDGSWIVRLILKIKYEHQHLDKLIGYDKYPG